MSDDPVAIVTGAGTGIGRQTALLLAEEGYRLTLVGRRREMLEETRSAVADGVETLVARVDLADGRKTGLVVDPTLEKWGRVDVLVNNAAVCPPITPIDQTTDDVMERTFAVNTFAPTRLVAALWPVFVRQRGGCVVNVSSMATVDPFPGLAAYAASKAALESLTRSIVNEGRAFRIRAFNIVPGAVEAPMLRELWSADELPPSRALDPRDVAQVITDCILGKREADIAGTIELPSP